MARIDRKQIWKLYRNGMRPAKITKEMNIPRNEIEKIIKEMASLKKSWLLFGAIAPIACATLILIVSTFTARQKTGVKKNEVVSPVSIEEHIQDLAGTYLANHAPDQWLVSKDAIESSQPKILFPVQENTAQKLEKIFSDNAEFPMVAQLKDAFSGHFYISFYTSKLGGTSINLSAKPLKPGPQTMEVVLYSEADHHQTERTSQIAMYDSDWHALIIAGLNLTPEWFQAITAHELLHALRDREGAASAHQPTLSDLWIREELEAHGLERQILNNNAIRGDYIAFLTEIARGKKSSVDLKSFFLSINIQDIQKLDSLFWPAGKSEASVRFTQYLTDLGEIWLSERYGDPTPENLRIANYRLLAKVFIRQH